MSKEHFFSMSSQSVSISHTITKLCAEFCNVIRTLNSISKVPTDIRHVKGTGHVTQCQWHADP